MTAMFASAGWGWHIETGVHLIRMILGGVFDRYPKLQVVIGHALVVSRPCVARY